MQRQSNNSKFFQMPKAPNIVGRSSSITNSFVNAIIPSIYPSDDEILEALNILGMDENNISCAYCGDQHTEWDHLRPIVRNKMPTGFISEIGNLVPSCGKCNQSKGNKPWQEWIESTAKLSPKSKGIVDLQQKINALRTFEAWRPATKLDLAELAGSSEWQKHWENWESTIKKMQESQEHANYVKETIQNNLEWDK